ncbi:3-ketoacyl-ACP synthase [Clavibacter michiganensis]|nr:3-ketoacyl-ACP synthase [Clavibacter michiganensis]
MNRVAVTAASAVTSVGDSLEATVASMIDGRSGFGVVNRFDTSTAAHRFGAFRAETKVDQLVSRVVDGLVHSGVLSVDRAYYAGEPNGPFPGVPAEIELKGGRSREASGWDRIYTGACVASSSALIDAACAIANGWARSVLVVGARLIDASTFFPFSAASALTKEPVVRPFTASRSGLLLGDGAGAILLEAVEDKSAQPLVELRGWGRAGDGFHVCQPEPQGRGMAVAITSALGRAGIAPSDIGHVSVHGTGTRLNDSAEAAALTTTFGASLAQARISSPKSAIGHTLEAAGVIEAAIAVKALLDSVVPANLGRRAEDEFICPGILEQPATVADLDHVLSLNLAFGGSNTALVFSRWDS